MSGNGLDGSGTPVWLKAAVQLGVTSIIAMGLVYWMATTLYTQNREMKAQLEGHAQEYMFLKGAITSHIDQTGRTNALILHYLQSMCFNTATDVEQRRRCIPPRDSSIEP
jgi:hypothetical protein